MTLPQSQFSDSLQLDRYLLWLHLFALLSMFVSCDTQREFISPYDPITDKSIWSPRSLQTVQVRPNKIQLSWAQSNMNIDGFVVVKEFDGQVKEIFVPKSTTVFIDENVAPDLNKCSLVTYKVYAKAGNNLSDPIISTNQYKYPLLELIDLKEEIISNSKEILLEAPVPSQGEIGVWRIISGSGGTIANTSSSKTLFNGIPYTNYELEWVVTNVCGFEEIHKVNVTLKTLPEVRFTNPVKVTGSSVYIDAETINDGGSPLIDKGVVISELPNATKGLPGAITRIMDEQLGKFTIPVFGLKPNTNYYLKAFATNEGGTMYSPEVSFTTGGFEQMFELVEVKTDTFYFGCSKDTLSLELQPLCPGNIMKVYVDKFKISKTEVTLAQWLAVMNTYPPNWVDVFCLDCPVYDINWYQASDFITELNKKSGRKFRMPTEAEWEYAARGGQKSMGYLYAGSNNFDDIGRVVPDLEIFPMHSVGLYKPNELGLYDMTGNVWEWCSDWWGAVNLQPIYINPQGSESGNLKITRGGRFRNFPHGGTFRSTFVNPNSGRAGIRLVEVE